jgi:hypothetical protein
MQISLTWPDIALTLVLGVLAIPIYNALVRIPRYWSLFRTWWADRSKKSALARIRKLRDEVQLVDQLRADPSRLVAYMAGLVGQVVLFLGLSVLFSIPAFIMLIVSSPKISRLFPSLASDITIVDRLSTVGMFVLITITLLSAMVAHLRLMTWRDLERRKRFLNDQIKRLSGRWGFP